MDYIKSSMYILILFIGGILRTEASRDGCPSIVRQSKHFAKVYGNTCYLFVNQEEYWNDARSDCWNLGGEMLSIKNATIMEFIRSVLNSAELGWFNQGVWLGARYYRGQWRWTTGVALKYKNWASGQPSRLLSFISVEDCALMRRNENWQWHDYFCGAFKFHYKYICEFPFKQRAHHEIYSGSQPRDNGNMAILTIILTSGGTVLLILLIVFLVQRRRYNYKKLMSQPEVYFENRNGSNMAVQPLSVSNTSHSSLPVSSLQSGSRPSSAHYHDMPEIGAARSKEEFHKPNGAASKVLNDSYNPESSSPTPSSPLCSDEELGACGGVLQQERECCSEDCLLSTSGNVAVLSQSRESLHDDTDNLSGKAVATCDESVSSKLLQNGLHVNVEGEVEVKKKEEPNDISDLHGENNLIEHRSSASPNYSNVLS